MIETIELAKLDEIHGGAARTKSAGLGGFGGLQPLQMQPLQMQSLSSDRTRYQPPGMNHHVEYNNGFKPNGDAKSWRSVDNATGRIIQSGDNP